MTYTLRVARFFFPRAFFIVDFPILTMKTFFPNYGQSSLPMCQPSPGYTATGCCGSTPTPFLPLFPKNLWKNRRSFGY